MKSLLAALLATSLPMAAPAGTENSADLLIRHATLVDVEHARLVADQTVAVAGDEIVAVGNDAPRARSRTWCCSTEIRCRTSRRRAIHAVILRGSLHERADLDRMLNETRAKVVAWNTQGPN